MTERGTPGDFARWVEPHLTVLTRYAARQVAAADRDDVVQEALIRAWQRWATYDASRGTPVAWLLGITADRCRRYRTRQPAGMVVELVDQGAAPTASHDLDLSRAVEGLSRRQRQAVDLHYFVGLDVATTAEVMGCAPGTVKATLHQARARLRELLGDDDD
ncbi:RNA polymerase sigma factor [Nocardioides cynanchi]|uniref:RNA polymerase sigma factor n=1 Tax=Nocardioides cynanchi TaxID=2558918 RepID=UPI0012477969|nr:RNA polymerase sigma factor [Nocardioides cynanchi]